MQVEDHPLGYFDFEGVIPTGQYGGGDVIVWDWGRWTPDPDQPDPQVALASGELKVRLDGEKLHGGFVLIRTDGWAKADRASPNGCSSTAETRKPSMAGTPTTTCAA